MRARSSQPSGRDVSHAVIAQTPATPAQSNATTSQSGGSRGAASQVAAPATTAGASDHGRRQPQYPAIALQRDKLRHADRRTGARRARPRALCQFRLARNERRHTLRPLAHRLPPYWRRTHGAFQLAVRASAWAANICCGSKIPTGRGPPLTPSRRSLTGSIGSASSTTIRSRSNTPARRATASGRGGDGEAGHGVSLLHDGG